MVQGARSLDASPTWYVGAQQCTKQPTMPGVTEVQEFVHDHVVLEWTVLIDKIRR